MSKQEDKDKIKQLISTSNANEPSELIGEKIPTKPTRDYRHTDSGIHHRSENRYYDFDYIIDVNHSKMTIRDVLNRYISRGLMKLNCVERCRKENNMRQGKYVINRNILFYLGLIIGILAFLTSSNILTGVTGILTGVYITIVFRSLVLGFYEFISNNPKNRDKIKNKIK